MKIKDYFLSRRDITDHTGGRDYEGPFFYEMYGKDAIMMRFAKYKLAEQFHDARKLITEWGGRPGFSYSIIIG